MKKPVDLLVEVRGLPGLRAAGLVILVSSQMIGVGWRLPAGGGRDRTKRKNARSLFFTRRIALLSGREASRVRL